MTELRPSPNPAAIVPDPNDERQVEVMARAHWDTETLRYAASSWDELCRLEPGTVGHVVLTTNRQKMRAALQALADLAKETGNG